MKSVLCFIKLLISVTYATTTFGPSVKSQDEDNLSIIGIIGIILGSISFLVFIISGIYIFIKDD